MELTLNDFVCVVILASLAAVAAFTAISRFFHWKSERKIKQLVTVCRLCGHVFFNEQEMDLIHCKACHAANRKHGNGKLG
jgi:uncharacterized OB-fold protein